MTISIAAPHAKGKFAQDKIFGASAAANKAAAQFGKENVTNATIGAILDENEVLVCLPTVEETYRKLSTNDLIAYAPIAGLPAYLESVKVAAFGKSIPEGHISAVATSGGSGALHHVVWNYTSEGDTILTSDWYWGPYNVFCKDMLRKLDTYQMLDDNLQYNLPALKAKVAAILEKQDSLVLIINTPAHNPTGYSLSDHDWDGVLNILKEQAAKGKNIILTVDVAYLDFAGEKEEVRKFFKKFSNLPSNILVLVPYSMSKGFTLYGQRTGALLAISSSAEVIKEFDDINQFTSRATWSNINRPCMTTLATIYNDPKLLAAVDKERADYYQMIKARADLFTAEAKEAGLLMLPYVAGFFLSIPTDNSDAVCDKLHEDNIFAVPLARGVRVAVCAVPLNKIKGMASKIKKAIDSLA